MEHIDNPMTMYFRGDEFNPDSPWFVDIDDLPTDRPEWEDEDYKYEQQREALESLSPRMYDLIFGR